MNRLGAIAAFNVRDGETLSELGFGQTTAVSILHAYQLYCGRAVFPAEQEQVLAGLSL